MKKINDSNKTGWIFLISILTGFAFIYFADVTKGSLIIYKFKAIIVEVIPVFALVYFVLLLTNYFVNNNNLKKIMQESTGFKLWALAIISGILSLGPIYMWYPLMQDLQQKGVKDRFLITFLYNRGIKLPWLPILITYYGIRYSLVLLVVMAILSVPQGLITEKLINRS